MAEVTNDILYELADCKIDATVFPPQILLKKPGRDSNNHFYPWTEAVNVAKATIIVDYGNLPQASLNFINPYVEALGKLDGPTIYVMAEILRDRGYEVIAPRKKG